MTTTTAATTTSANTSVATAPPTFSPFHWYIENSARFNKEVADEAGIPATHIFWIAMDIISDNRFQSIALPLVEFEAGFKQVVRDAALRTKALRAAAQAESAAAKLAEDIAQENEYPRKRRAELKDLKAKRAIAPTPAERILPQRRAASSKRVRLA